MSEDPTYLIKYTVVDAFTDRVFSGNPAAVIVLPEDANDSATPKLDDRTSQLIAREFNLSETAFITPRPSSSTLPTFGLRWFTPKSEVNLCGHATLASAHALFSSKLITADASLIHFETRSGTLTARKAEGGKIELEFPAGIPERAEPDLEEKARRAVVSALGVEHKVVFVGVGKGVSFYNYMLIELETPFDLEKASINPGGLLDLAPEYQVIILTVDSASTNLASGTHFLSRTFDPHSGAPEDPVTGSAHCMLTPYWHQKLKLQPLEVMCARQVSERGGSLDIVWDQEKGTCRLLGQAKTAIKGELLLPV